jgi:hypothetical protein
MLHTDITAKKLILCIALTNLAKPVAFEVFAAVTMKSAVFWDVTPFDWCKNQRLVGTFRFHQPSKNRRFGRTYCLHRQVKTGV